MNRNRSWSVGSLGGAHYVPGIRSFRLGAAFAGRASSWDGQGSIRRGYAPNSSFSQEHGDGNFPFNNVK